MSNTNIFGGKNPNALYTPMTEDEQEVLARLVEAEDMEIHVKQWGVVNKFMERPVFGDKRIQIKFWVKFSKPDVLIPVHYFELELRTRAGQLLYAEKQAVKDANGGPLMVGAGIALPLCWDIAIQQMDTRLVKDIKPGAHGLTTREGNRRLSESEQLVFSALREREAKVREDTRQEAEEATKKSSY
jgi:hypothetical protein